MLVTAKVVADDPGTVADRQIDYAGINVLTLGLVALLLALDEGTDRGWTNPLIVALFAIAAIALVAFAFIERRAGDKALVPGDVLANRTFVAACITTLMMSATFFTSLLYLPQFMVRMLHYNAMQAGAGLLPMMGVFALTSFVAGPLYGKLGPRVIVSFGAAFLALGMYLISRVTPTTMYEGLVPGMVVLGVGVGLFYSSVTTAGITALDPSRSGLAGGVVYMFQIAGGSIGLGLSTALVVTADSLAEGMDRAFLVDAVLALCGLGISIAFIGGPVDHDRRKALRHHHRAHAP
jgi:predicted MFS family arabinose efflux permease